VRGNLRKAEKTFIFQLFTQVFSGFLRFSQLFSAFLRKLRFSQVFSGFLPMSGCEFLFFLKKTNLRKREKT